MNFWEYLNARAVRNANTDLLIAQAQRAISARTLLIIAGVIATLLFMPLVTDKPIDPVVEKLLYVVLGGLITNWAGQNQFWYGRPRAGGIPDPSGQVTTTREDPDGTKTVTSMPALAAAPAVVAAPVAPKADPPQGG